MRFGRLQGDTRPIPYTFGRYVATTTGQIYDNFKKVICHPDVNGNISLRVDNGIDYNREYLWFIILAFKPIHLPFEKAKHFHYKLDQKYLTNDFTKYIWYLNEPLESDHYPEHYIIPGYTRYVISKEGNVISSYGTGRIIEPIKDIRDDHYKNVYMVDDYNKGSNESIHRLIAGTFLEIPPDAPELVVNHIDLNTHNNAPENLEWVSHHVNLAHAQLMYENNIGNLTIKITKCGKESSFISITEAATFLNVTKIDIWKAFTGKQPIPEIKVDITYSDGGEIKGHIKQAKIIEVKNLFTGETISFITMHACARFFETRPSNIHQAISKHYVIAGKFVARYNNTAWPNITREDIVERGRISSGPKPVLLYDIKLKEIVRTFPSANDLVKFLRQQNLGSKKTITQSLKRGNQRRFNDYIFKYSTDNTPWQH